jgi:8-oxo-dGTP diphosphatase
VWHRRRGTAIVETKKGILVVSGHGKVFMLPGGAANHKESRLQAAIRELQEETGLVSRHSSIVG